METDGFSFEYRIKLYRGGEKCFGPGMAEMLRRVEEQGSLNAAARTMEMAYSKAWRMIKTSEKSLGIKLLEAHTGGKNGGGATLTPEAVKLLKSYELFAADAERELRRLFQERFADCGPQGSK